MPRNRGGGTRFQLWVAVPVSGLLVGGGLAALTAHGLDAARTDRPADVPSAAEERDDTEGEEPSALREQAERPTLLQSRAARSPAAPVVPTSLQIATVLPSPDWPGAVEVVPAVVLPPLSVALLPPAALPPPALPPPAAPPSPAPAPAPPLVVQPPGEPPFVEPGAPPVEEPAVEQPPGDGTAEPPVEQPADPVVEPPVEQPADPVVEPPVEQPADPPVEPGVEDGTGQATRAVSELPSPGSLVESVG